ncbi:hypothetical protein [Acuticoccus kandeliae]|uniref:hypothetical protein n=1 Tax=Acuticoccus kandeliae TaxID=2073160 RepID=UPI000D3E36E5|nr:hypothetical protein [Acuticoccus kandeliae]
MRIAIVAPSAAFAESAGARIRYRRLIDAAPAGTIAMTPIDALAEADAYLFSKTYQSAAPALAYSLAARGKRVALDVFDDYFSDPRDTRMARFRHWFDEMARAVHRVTVSTPALADRLEPRLPARPLVIPDPAAPIDPAALAATLRRKAEAMDPDALEILWFGIASNPYFEAGLGDLAAFAGALGAAGTRHRLTILTNAAGAKEEALAALAKAPVPVRWAEWSEAAEAEALARADVAVLPVGSGPFVTAKSLNRAITALSAGTQVLSLGAPLYAPLDTFLYRDLETLIADARCGSLRLRWSRAAWLIDKLDRVASAADGARRLAAMFEAIAPEPRPPHAVILGEGAERDLVAASGALTIGFDDAADIALGALGDAIHLSPAARAQLAPAHRSGATLAPASLGLAVPPPLSGHGVVDLVRQRERFGAARAAAAALLPDHAVFLAHDGLLAP